MPEEFQTLVFHQTASTRPMRGFLKQVFAHFHEVIQMKFEIDQKGSSLEILQNINLKIFCCKVHQQFVFGIILDTNVFVRLSDICRVALWSQDCPM